MLEHFSDGLCTMQDVQQCLNTAPPNTLAVADLEHVVRGLIPIVVLKQMLRVDNMRIRIVHMPNFGKFVDIYKDRIIG
jgi:hypothetical protein